jgi:hypothetical protein
MFSSNRIFRTRAHMMRRKRQNSLGGIIPENLHNSRTWVFIPCRWRPAVTFLPQAWVKPAQLLGKSVTSAV